MRYIIAQAKFMLTPWSKESEEVARAVRKKERINLLETLPRDRNNKIEYMHSSLIDPL